MATLTQAAIFAGRVLIAVLFLGGAVQKMMNPDAAGALLTDAGLPFELVWVALVFNAVAGVALIVGIGVAPVAALLAVYCGVTSFFHLIPDDPWQMSIFVKNWAIAGGCLILAAHAWDVKSRK